jgi:hypothetical protein
MRNFLLGLTLILVAPLAAHASPVTYDLVLTNVAGNISGGTGSFTINNAPDTGLNAVSLYQQSDNSLSAISFLIDGTNFTLADTFGGTLAQFISGDLSDITYFGINSTFTISLAANGLQYQFYNAVNGDNSVGTVSASLAGGNTAVPEPNSVLLFGTGLLAFAAIGSRKLLSSNN